MAKSTRPFSGFEWMVALRYLRARRQETLISVISGFSLVGIALGVATLIIVMSVMNGFRAELLDRILGMNGHLFVQSYAGPMTNYDAIVRRMEAIPGVVSATPVVEGQVMVTTPAASRGALIRGMAPEDLAKLTGVSSTFMPANTLARFRAGTGVIIGTRLADMLRVQPGGTLTLLSASGAPSEYGPTPSLQTYAVDGTFRVGMSQYDESVVFMPLAEAQNFFGTGNAAHRIDVIIAEPDRVQEWRAPVMRAAGALTRVVDWQQMNAGVTSVLQVQRDTMFLILTMIILVAALNIISGLIMLVKDKSGDIAIMRTMGASRGAMMRVFFIAGASVGVVGTAIGFLLAMLFVDNIEAVRQVIQNAAGVDVFNPEVYFLTEIPALIDWMDVLSVVAMALGLSFLATLYPAWRAARLDPVEALRYA